MQEMIPLMNKNRICYRVIRRSHRFFLHEMAGGGSRRRKRCHSFMESALSRQRVENLWF